MMMSPTQLLSRVLNPQRFMIMAFGAATILLAACQGTGGGYAPFGSLSADQKLKSVPQPGPTFSFVSVTDPSGANTLVTGIDTGPGNVDRIVGVSYGSGSSPTYSSFISDPNSSGQYTHFTPEPPAPNPGDIYLSGLNQSNEEVGYGPATTSSSCRKVCGYIRDPNASPTLAVIAATNEGTGQCSYTYVLGINNSKVAVGYYGKNAGGGCINQAFEEYCEPGNSSSSQCNPHFADFHPDIYSEGYNNSIAWGVNNKGDVVGTMSATPSGQSFGWKYNEFNYKMITSAQVLTATSVQPQGVNWDGVIVGSFTCIGACITQQGFVLTSLTGTAVDINDGTNGTAVSSINDAWKISGWHRNGSNNQVGFVGLCKANCTINSAPPSPRNVRKQQTSSAEK